MYKGYKIFQDSHMGMWLKFHDLYTKAEVINNGLYVLTEKISKM